MTAAAELLTGSGELRHKAGAGPDARYAGALVLGERTILITAQVEQDERGRFFALSATLDPATYTQTQLDRLVVDDGTGGAGLGLPQQPRRSGPLVDDPIPFGAA